MPEQFNAQRGDKITEEHFPSGEIKVQTIIRNGFPADGWSQKEFYQNGTLKADVCYSHSTIIERIVYDGQGQVISHKIFNQRLRQMADRPKVVPLPRPNVISGYDHMGFFLKHLPAISKFINAVYDEKEFKEAYTTFVTMPYAEQPEELTWCLKGESMIFLIGFCKGEMLYQWNLRAPDDADYRRAGHFMGNLERK